MTEAPKCPISPQLLVGLPEQLFPMAFLLGEWVGHGELHYPTIETKQFAEQIAFSHDGRPFLAYAQRTRIIEPARPAHRESGFWRLADGKVEVVLAQVTGLVEVLEGTISNSGDSWAIDLASTSVTGTSTAVPVEATTRRFEGDGMTLRYDMSMAAAGQDMTHHLHAEFIRPEAAQAQAQAAAQAQAEAQSEA